MNVFVLDSDPKLAARYHCDKHVVKMILEAAQMLSTAHRLLDGNMQVVKTTSGRKKKIWVHPDPRLNQILYGATHYNHPSNVWTRECSANYVWHYQLFVALCEQYTHRYGKKHLTETKLRDVLAVYPFNIKKSVHRTQFALAMKSAPECMNPDDPVGSYRAFYKTKAARFNLNWTNVETPYWYTT